ncbi:MAG TPA: folylpolyglutamate synthase/dihydrofolate synthase family protein [Anaerolineae bacterium]
MNEETRDDAYQKALDYLYSFIDFERKKQDRYMASKLDPTRPKRLLDHLGAPYRHFPAIHIAGTKGKGSVAAMCAACLRAAGLKVGLYTSPHLIDFRERIRVLTPADTDGHIPKASFVALMEQLKTAVEYFPDITWFEVLTAIAFLHFAKQQVDIGVIEVGLGGRLDATNVVTPLVSVITSLSLDHTQLLGNTLSQIAYEKGGIIKPGVPVVTAPQPPEALARLIDIAREREAPVTIVGQHWIYEGRPATGEQELLVVKAPDSAFSLQPLSSNLRLPSPHPSSFILSLAGQHQLENAAVALAALHVVQPHFPGLDEAAVRQGLATVQWPGRLQILHQAEDTPTILVDCAHNPDSAAKLRYALTHDYDYERLWLILGAPTDKDIAGMMVELLPLAAGIIVTTASHPRSAAPEELLRLSAELGYEATLAADMETALTLAWENAGAHDLICVTGSIIVVGDLLNQWESLQSRLLRHYAVT